MLEIAVIADDLTGAADTGVQFCPYFPTTILTSYRNVSLLSSSMDHDALSVYTNTRHMRADEARERLIVMSRELNQLHPNKIYKKVDSSLRGNIGAEVDAIVDEMSFDLSFIAPAFPDMGRSTLHDIHLIHGKPVAETELFRDPVTPVTESRLSQVVASQCLYEVGHVDLHFLDDDKTLHEEVQRLVSDGARHLVFDTTRNEHMDRIARIGLDSAMKILLVGSAGLARGLGNQLQPRPSTEGQEPRRWPEGHHLMVCGTVSERTRTQIAALKETYPYEIIPLTPSILADASMRRALLKAAGLARHRLSQNDLIIQVQSLKGSGSSPQGDLSTLTAHKIVEGLGGLVASIVRETKPASLFLSGGDTASAVLEAIDVTGIRLYEEIVPGVPYGELIGGLIEGLPVITKAGAFGERNTLVAVHEYWLRRKRGESL
jgi:uncharacterized protein YgbK (DUF1537 family)